MAKINAHDLLSRQALNLAQTLVDSVGTAHLAMELDSALFFSLEIDGDIVPLYLTPGADLEIVLTTQKREKLSVLMAWVLRLTSIGRVYDP